MSGPFLLMRCSQSLLSWWTELLTLSPTSVFSLISLSSPHASFIYPLWGLGLDFSYTTNTHSSLLHLCKDNYASTHGSNTPSFVNSFLIPQMKMTSHSSELSYILQSDMKLPFVSCDRFMYTPFLHMSLSFSEIQL